MATVEEAQVLLGKVVRSRTYGNVGLVVKVCTWSEKYADGSRNPRAVMDVVVRHRDGTFTDSNWWAEPDRYDIYEE